MVCNANANDKLLSGLAALVTWGSELGYSSAELLIYRAFVQTLVAFVSHFFQSQKTKTNKPSKEQIAAIIGRGLFGMSCFKKDIYFSKSI